MRLTCPTCGAIYEPPEGLLPSVGSHVQCTACHTRWFFRPARPAPAMSEDQILARLETRRPDLTLAGQGAQAAPEGPPGDAATGGAPREPERAPEAEPPAPPPGPRRRLDLTGREVGGAAEPVHGPAALPAEADTPGPLRPTVAAARPVQRVEIGAETRAGRNRFAIGLTLGLLLGAGALGLYRYGEPIGAKLPAAVPMLDAYDGHVASLRERIEAGLGPLRDRLTGD